MRPPTIAVVTGASRGIGAAICRSLASAPPSVPLVLYAVSRSGSSLNIPSIAAGVSLKFDRLDLGNLETAAALATRLQKEHGSIDVLINNAGIYHYTLEEGREEQMTKEMLDVNYRGTLMASSRTNTATQLGWARKPYFVSKALETAMTMALSREFPELLINACCPGWVSTDLGNQAGKAPKTLEEGARVPIRVGFGDIGNVTGEYWANAEIWSTAEGQVQHF